MPNILKKTILATTYMKVFFRKNGAEKRGTRQSWSACCSIAKATYSNDTMKKIVWKQITHKWDKFLSR